MNIDNLNNLINGDVNSQQIIIDEVDDNTTYIGVSKSGTTKSSNKWLIKKVYANGNITNIAYPNGDSNFNFIWDDRLTYDFTIN